MANATTTVQDLTAVPMTDTQRAFITARLSVNDARKSHRSLKMIAGKWGTDDASQLDVAEARDEFIAKRIKAYTALDALGKDMRPSRDVREALNIPKVIEHGGDLAVMLKVALPGGGKMTAAVRAFLKG